LPKKHLGDEVDSLAVLCSSSNTYFKANAEASFENKTLLLHF
jgi:hypothetical protein